MNQAGFCALAIVATILQAAALGEPASTPPATPSFGLAEGCLLAPLGGSGTSAGPLVLTNGKPAKARTTAVLRTDAQALTVEFNCIDEKIIVKEGRKRDDAELWKDDCVEVFLDAGHEHDLMGRWFHVLVSAAGAVMDERGPVREFYTSGEPVGGDPKFDVANLKVETKRIDGGWSARIVIPWASIAVKPEPGAVVGLNLCRTDHPDDEYQCLFPTRGVFLQPDRWGHLALTDNAAQAAQTVAQQHERNLQRMKQAVDQLEMFRAVPTKLNQPSVKIGGVIYGAQADDRGPIGGGEGYIKTYKTGDFIAKTTVELIAALKAAKVGQVVFIPGSAEIDFTEMIYTDKLVLEVPGGVTLASDRGVNGSPGGLIFSDAFQTRPLIRTGGADVVITGLRVRGPDSKIRQEHHDRSLDPGKSKTENYYYLFPVSAGIQGGHDRLTVANCEIFAWSYSGVTLADSGSHQVHHCYIHHNRHQGLGYGVSLNKAQALIEQNLFEHNRHDIAGTGAAEDSYEACNNVVLWHQAVSHHFDMHGGADRKDGTDIAGGRILIHHNAFYGSEKPVNIRGVPAIGAEIHHNWFPRHRPVYELVDMVRATNDAVVRSLGNTKIYDNAYGSVTVK